MSSFRVAEIFASIQGESHWAGYPCTFLRLAGCNLDCSYCDTAYARATDEAARYDQHQLLQQVASHGLPLVELTGGEPLLQAGTPALLQALLKQGHRVLLETNGSLPLDEVPVGTHVVMDLKTPGSGMAQHNHWDNLPRLRATDEIKVVCCDREDYEWFRNILRQGGKPREVRVSLSAAWGRLLPAELARWVLDDRLEVRLQVQLHRVLWPDAKRGV